VAGPQLHFRIRLNPETAHLDGPLRREIQRRWPYYKETRDTRIISTLEITHGEQEFAIEILGWPAKQASIRAFLEDLIQEGGWLVP